MHPSYVHSIMSVCHTSAILKIMLVLVVDSGPVVSHMHHTLVNEPHFVSSIDRSHKIFMAMYKPVIAQLRNLRANRCVLHT